MRADHSSRTACFIARSLIFSARGPESARLVSSRSLAMALAGLHAEGVDARRWWRLCGVPWIRRLLTTMERWLLPGIVLHYVLRKRAIAEAVNRELVKPERSAVVIGCGLDALSWQIRRDHPRARVQEIDHPATLALRRRACAGTGSWPERKACDLATDDLALGLDDQTPAVVVLEGLLMYLEADRVLHLLRTIATTTAPGSLIIFTTMIGDPAAAIRFADAHPLIDRWLAKQGEPFRWSIRREDLAASLQQVGLSLCSVQEAADLARAHLPSTDRRCGAAGEAVVTARTGP